MANITKNNNTYKITVSCGYDVKGKKIRQYKTWKPDSGMTEKQAEKEVQKVAFLFEQDCLKGQITASIKFEDFAVKWFKEYADIALKARTIENYHWLEKRAYKAIGYLRMGKINSRHIQQFITDMVDGKRTDKKKGKLSPKTIKDHISFISTIFTYAEKMQVVSTNPCKAVTLPRANTKEKEIYTLEETQQLLELLVHETDKNKSCALFTILAIYTGFRRGELLGLEWKDFQDNVVTIKRTSNYTVKKGVYTDTPKTNSSYRSLKLPDEVMKLIIEFKEYQQNYIDTLGDKWEETDRLFTTWNGKPMFPNTPSLYFGRFCKKTGLRYVNVHQWRHLNASLLIYGGVDVKTVQNCLGHSSANTTLSIYAHTFQTAQVKAMGVVSDSLNLKKSLTV